MTRCSEDMFLPSILSYNILPDHTVHDSVTKVSAYRNPVGAYFESVSINGVYLAYIHYI